MVPAYAHLREIDVGFVRDIFVSILKKGSIVMYQVFQDRVDAAQQLAVKLKSLPLIDPLVLAIPRGGVVTGAELAYQLGADLDVVLAHKLRSPHEPELAIGAVSEDGEIFLDRKVTKLLEITDRQIEEECRKQVGEMDRRRKLFRSIRPPASLTARSVIITDDGVATGATLMAALEVVKERAAHEIIVAIPVIPAERVAEIREKCDRLIYLNAPTSFYAVGQFYEYFAPIDDSQVVELLQQFSASSKTKA